MTDRRRAAVGLIGAVAGAMVLVVAIDWSTNSIDTTRFSWDFRYYIDMARRGLVPPLAGPFAYRYLTPLLVRMISAGLQIPVEAGFGLLARVAAFTQLISVFLLARWYSKSTRGAWVAMLVTSFSLFHVKFLLFDTFRPDHLAYPLIVLQVYLGLKRKFWPLWMVTLVACQVREFNAVPLVAWVFVALWEARASGRGDGRGRATEQALISVLGLAVALLLPRVLIPIAEDYQFASLTEDGLLRAVLAPLILARDANYVYSVLAYALPILMVASPPQLHLIWAALRRWDRGFLGAYCALVLALSFLGGTDFGRFSTFLLPPLALVLASVTDRCTPTQLLAMLAAIFVFNRIWRPIPDADVEKYLDFYGAYGTRFTLASVLRIGELAGFLGAGILIRKVSDPQRHVGATPSG
jgi:hypothetical protein